MKGDFLKKKNNKKSFFERTYIMASYSRGHHGYQNPMVPDHFHQSSREETYEVYDDRYHDRGRGGHGGHHHDHHVGMHHHHPPERGGGGGWHRERERHQQYGDERERYEHDKYRRYPAGVDGGYHNQDPYHHRGDFRNHNYNGHPDHYRRPASPRGGWERPNRDFGESEYNRHQRHPGRNHRSPPRKSSPPFKKSRQSSSRGNGIAREGRGGSEAACNTQEESRSSFEMKGKSAKDSVFDAPKCNEESYDCSIKWHPRAEASGPEAKLAFIPARPGDSPLRQQNLESAKRLLLAEVQGSSDIPDIVKLEIASREEFSQKPYGKQNDRETSSDRSLINPVVAMALACSGSGPCLFLYPSEKNFADLCKDHYEQSIVSMTLLGKGHKLYLVSVPDLGKYGLKGSRGMYGWIVTDQTVLESGSEKGLVNMVMKSLQNGKLNVALHLDSLLGNDFRSQPGPALEKLRRQSPLLDYLTLEEQARAQYLVSFFSDTCPEDVRKELEEQGHFILDSSMGLPRNSDSVSPSGQAGFRNCVPFTVMITPADEKLPDGTPNEVIKKFLSDMRDQAYDKIAKDITEFARLFINSPDRIGFSKLEGVFEDLVKKSRDKFNLGEQVMPEVTSAAPEANNDSQQVHDNVGAAPQLGMETGQGQEEERVRDQYELELLQAWRDHNFQAIYQLCENERANQDPNAMGPTPNGTTSNGTALAPYGQVIPNGYAQNTYPLNALVPAVPTIADRESTVVVIEENISKEEIYQKCQEIIHRFVNQRHPVPPLGGDINKYNYIRVSISDVCLNRIRNLHLNASGGRQCTSNKSRLNEIFQNAHVTVDLNDTQSMPTACWYKFYSVQTITFLNSNTSEPQYTVLGIGLGTKKKIAEQAASLVTLESLGFETLPIT